ncbi:MAG: Crp/Fnr family transcriptional regulator [Limnochordaceae bacterium]|nr:Crp/Fnr family transcriptional regulator [Limnochordaceae bacterium]
MGLDCIRRLAFFANFSPSELEQIFSLTRTLSLVAGQPLILEGEPADRLYLVKSGTVRLSRTSPDGRSFTLDIVGVESIIGTEALFQADTYHSTAHALEPICVLEFRQAQLEQLLLDHPELALKVIKSLSRALMESADAFSTAVLSDARGRLMHLLRRLGQRHGIQTPAGLRISLPLTHQELADMAGLARQTVTVLLNQLRAEGLIAIDGHRHIVLTESFPSASSVA